MGTGGGQYATHFFVAEDIGQKDRYLDRRQRMLWYVARRITATPIEAKLAQDAELVGDRHGLAIGDARAPLPDRVVEPYLAMIARQLPDKAHERIEDELGAPIGDAHGPLEAQELLHLMGQLIGGHGRHVGTGSETSRSVSVAILT